MEEGGEGVFRGERLEEGIAGGSGRTGMQLVAVLARKESSRLRTAVTQASGVRLKPSGHVGSRPESPRTEQ